MQDVPQPLAKPYSVGDRVRVYIGPDDPDARFHGCVCEVVNVHTDDLDANTGRCLDAYSYSLHDTASDEVLPVAFRHADLVLAEDSA